MGGGGVVEHGVSGAKDRRPVLDQLLADVRRRRFDAVVCKRRQASRQRTRGSPLDAPWGGAFERIFGVDQLIAVPAQREDMRPSSVKEDNRRILLLLGFKAVEQR